MEEEKLVKLTGTEAFGEEKVNVPFIDGAWVVFRTDVDNETYQKFRQVIKGADTDDTKKKIDTNDELMKLLVPKMIKDWNFGDEDGKKIEISYENIIKKCSMKLIQWLTEKMTGFFTMRKG